MATGPTYNYPPAWETWAVGVLNGIGAPATLENFDSLWNWTAAEKPAGQPIQWNNPLNSTWKLPGSVDSGAQPGPHDVQIYPDMATGQQATILTLKGGDANGPYYSNIVGNLQQSKARQYWTNAVGDLGTWGTVPTWIKAQGNGVSAIDTQVTGPGNTSSSISTAGNSNALSALASGPCQSLKTISEAQGPAGNPILDAISGKTGAVWLIWISQSCVQRRLALYALALGLAGLGAVLLFRRQVKSGVNVIVSDAKKAGLAAAA